MCTEDQHRFQINDGTDVAMLNDSEPGGGAGILIPDRVKGRMGGHVREVCQVGRITKHWPESSTKALMTLQFLPDKPDGWNG